MNRRYTFILIDDIAVNNLLAKRIIDRTYPGAAVIHFTSAQSGLDYIQEHFPLAGNGKITILLLDIYMPAMNGWDFLDAFDGLEDSIRSQINVWLLSSSISPEDRERAAQNKYVSGYILKPFTADAVIDVVQRLND